MRGLLIICSPVVKVLRDLCRYGYKCFVTTLGLPLVISWLSVWVFLGGSYLILASLATEGGTQSSCMAFVDHAHVNVPMHAYASSLS